MGFEQSPLGDGSVTGSGNVTTAIANHYGPRKSNAANGVYETDGVMQELSIEITGVELGNAAYPLLAPTLPAGAVIEDAYVKVSEAFVLGGTTPAIEIGTETSEATNGVTITEAQAEATGSYDVTAALSGTWAAPLAAARTVGLALSGTTPTTTTAGKLELVVRYFKV